MDDTEVLVALIGALGVVVAAWIGARARGRKNNAEDTVRSEVVGHDKIGGDRVGRDKVETHEHLHFANSKAERKNAFVYVLEKVITFLVTLALAGLIFGGLGALLGGIGGESGIYFGGGIGLFLAFVMAIVNAGNVKRTKGFS